MELAGSHSGRTAFVLGLSLGGFLSCNALLGQGKAGQVEAAASGGVVRMAPFTVTAVYPTITVRARLSGHNLFDPANDSVLALNVIRVTSDGDIGREEIEPGDQLLAINDTDLAGLTLRQISAVLAAARKAGLPVFHLRRGLAVLGIPFDGQWDPSLPELTR